MFVSLLPNSSRKLLLILAMLSTSLLTSCGGSGGNQQVVTDIQVGTYTSGGDVMVEFNTLLDIGNLTLPTVMIPINHPQTGRDLGHVDLKASFDGRNEIGLQLNVTGAFNASTSQNSKLPNDTDIPIGGVQNVDVTNFPITQSGAQVYLGLAKNVSFVGTAIPIKEFDVLGANVGAVNLFARFDIEGVIGIAGIFTGPSGQNGLGIFVDTSKYFDPTDIIGNFPLPKQNLRLAKDVEQFGGLKAANPLYIDQSPDSRVERRLKRNLYKLHRRRTQLNI